jgi:hypothetical protein
VSPWTRLLRPAVISDVYATKIRLSKLADRLTVICREYC